MRYIAHILSAMFAVVFFTQGFACGDTNPKSETTTEQTTDASTKDESSKDEGTKDTDTKDESTKDDSKTETVPDVAKELPVESVQESAQETVTKEENVVDSPKEADPQDTTGSKCTGTESVVKFKTSDNVELEADYWQASKEGQGVVVLFHMVPPTFNRTSYPQRVRKAIHDMGLNVLNVDRRGAGNSGGTASQAYTGLTARLDMEAALRFLGRAACGFDSKNILLVGASNGSTSVLDHTVNRSDSILPDPKALLFFSPGSYTETQNKIRDHLATLKTLPILFLYPTNEASYSKGFDDGTSSVWSFFEIQGGQHGTQNFDNGALEAKALPEFLKWIKTHLVP